VTISTTDCRGDVIDRCIELLKDHPNLTDVTVEPEHPGDKITAEAVYLSNVEGESLEIAVITPGRKSRDDIFKLTWVIQVTNRADYAETRQRVTEIVAALEDLAADHGAQLDDDPESLLSIETSNKNGPLIVRTDKGRMGIAEVEHTAHCRLE
jgi:hypothetical protein